MSATQSASQDEKTQQSMSSNTLSLHGTPVKNTERQQHIRLRFMPNGDIKFFDAVKTTPVSELYPTWVGGVSGTITTVTQRASCVTYYEIDKP